MRKAKEINRKTFNTLSYNDKVNELRKMAKRANVRSALLEDTKQYNEVYKQAENYNKQQGREKNRFYEGKKYNSQKEINDSFTALSNFLNNKLSTLGGIEKEVSTKIETLIDKGQFDYKTLNELTDKEKIYASKKMASLANKRLRNLEDNGIDYYAYANAKHYNEASGRNKNRFYRGGKFKNDRDLNIHIQNMGKFLNARSSTIEGIEQSYNNRINTFRNKGVNIPIGKEKEFFDFLSSQQFKALAKYADSDQIAETYANARNKDIDVDLINEGFTKFMNDEMSWDQVQEFLHIAKWQQGGLLK